MWDLNCDVKSLEKADFLTIRVYLTTTWKEKGEGELKVNVERKRGLMH